MGIVLIVRLFHVAVEVLGSSDKVFEVLNSRFELPLDVTLKRGRFLQGGDAGWATLERRREEESGSRLIFGFC